jgi:hypothetical protein
MHILRWGLALLLGVLAGAGWAADPSRCTVKMIASDVPKEVAEPIRQLLSNQAIQVLDEQGKPFCEIWVRKTFPLKTADDLKKGYNAFPESTIFGAVRFSQPWSSYRKQNIKPGVYTLRLGFQPQDGDHQGTAPFNEFLLLCRPTDDTKNEIMSHKHLTEMSGKSIPGTSHPAILLLYPNPKPPDQAKLVNMGGGNWVLSCKGEAAAGEQKGIVGLCLTLFGATTAE